MIVKNSTRKERLFLIVARHPIFWRVALLLISLIAFEEVVDDVIYDPNEGDFEAVALDKAITSYFLGLRSELATHFMTDFTSLGSFSVLGTLCLIAGLFLLTLGRIRQFSQLLVSGLGVLTIVPLLKIFFDRSRPDVSAHLVTVADLSFPSGHAFGAACMYTALTFIALSSFPRTHEKVVSVFIGLVLIALVSISRIYLGVHFPTDVMAGIAGGVAWATLVELLFQPQYYLLLLKYKTKSHS